MAETRCPMCSKLNPDNLESCQHCQARLKPLIVSGDEKGQTVRPGEAPVKKATAEFEKVTLPPQSPIRPGEAPTKKDTGELEQALPAWLRSLRGQEDTQDETPAETPAGPVEASDDRSTGETGETGAGLRDWLAGMIEKPADEVEQAADWLSGIRAEATEDTLSSPEPDEMDQSGGEDWLARLGGTSEITPAMPAGADVLADEFDSEMPTPQQPEATPATEPSPKVVFPDWLAGLQAGVETPQETQVQQPGEAVPAESMPDWMAGLQPQAETPQEAHVQRPDEAAPAESMPDWMAGLQPQGTPEAASPAETPAVPSDALPDWLASAIRETVVDEVTVAPVSNKTETPDWLQDFRVEPSSEESDLADNNIETSHQPVAAADFPPKTEKPTEPMPGWLADIERSVGPSESTPALIVDHEGTMSGSATDAAYSMEMPDWINKLKPDASKTPPAFAGQAGDEEPEDLAPAELPSWVKAMRPVESVVAEARVTQPAEEGMVEQQGPLAGLSGVLPPSPGLGPLRKPPAYSITLQTTEEQQRYASLLEQMISEEATSQPAKKKKRDLSVRIIRWMIAAVLFLAVSVPFLTGVQLAPPSTLYPPELIAAFNTIGALPANGTVLLAFDYEPALSGELEAAAAPVFDQLLFLDTKLTFISTSPTGPILAEHFMQITRPAYGHQTSGEYINLGYLAGGPAGVLYFAVDPVSTAPLTVGGDPAWELPALQNIRTVSDFAAVIVLTDNADTGRTWIEQTAPYLGETPLLMVISAQAEPMIRPYYDSGQLDGLVTGLAGGKSYEQAVQMPGLSERYWNAFSIGLFVAVVIITLGSAWSLVGVLINRRKLREEKDVL